MNKALWSVGLTILVALVGLGCGGGDSKSTTETPAAPTLTKDETAFAEALAASAVAARTEALTHLRETARARPTRTPRPTIPPPYKLALISASCTRSSSTFIRCEGFVKNLTSNVLENVEVLINWYDANDIPRSSDEALIDFNPILPGQTSPWSSIGTYNPALTTFRVQFKELLGGSILTRDDR